MKIADILNPSAASIAETSSSTTMFSMTELHHPLLVPVPQPYHHHYYRHHLHPMYHQECLIPVNYSKPRNRFSEYEDAVICKGVAFGLTWGQISAQLPNRKRATCFNRYRTLQGIRKSRKNHHQRMLMGSFCSIAPGSSSRRASTVSSCSSVGSTRSSPAVGSSWLPTTPPSFKDIAAHSHSAIARTSTGFVFNDLHHHHHRPGHWMGPVVSSRYHFGYH